MISRNPSLLKHPHRSPPCVGNQNGRWDHDNNTWFPDDCIYFKWAPSQAAKCVAKKTLIFVGDAYTRNLFRCFADTISKGFAKDAYKGESTLSCDNYIAAHHVDVEYHGRLNPKSTSKTTEYHLYFYWNPLISYNAKWCHLETCEKHNAKAPPGSTCTCPPASRVPISYTGHRVRLPFLQQLLEKHKADFVITAPGVGDVDESFIKSLTLVPTVIVTHNPNHDVMHTELPSDTVVLDMSQVIKRRKDQVLIEGHLTLHMTQVLINELLSIISFVTCPFERKYFQ